MKVQSLQLGDVLLDTYIDSTAGHCMIWVNGPKAVAHSADGNIKAVVRNFASDVLRDSDSKSPATFHVHRYKDVDVAARACEFAQDWASPDRDTSPPSGHKLKYSGHRETYGKLMRQHPSEVPDQNWDVMSLFHAVRALAKARQHQPLSGKGISCTQFVAYCYQCASIEKTLGAGQIDPKALAGLIVKDSTLALVNEPNVVRAKLTAIDQLRLSRENKPPRVGAEGPKNDPRALLFGMAGISVAESLMFDAKYADIGLLQRKISSPDSGFTQVGFAIPLTAPKLRVDKNDELFLVPTNELTKDMKKARLDAFLAQNKPERP
jgi:hypothetical protein